MEKQVRVLDSWQIAQKTKRIAHQIAEQHYREKKVVVVGIKGSGFPFSEKLVEELRAIKQFEVLLFSIKINKKDPLGKDIEMSGDLSSLKNQVVVLSDDVLNSGLTMMYAARHLLQVNLKTLATATLIDRFHRKYPIRADYVGLTLSTNLKEHVTVVFEKGKEEAFLD